MSAAPVAGGAAPVRTPGSGSAAVESSAWAPLRQPAFRWLWLGVLISSIGTWMQTVGAQWLLVDAPNAAALVALVQTANTLPVMLLALPGGVLAAGLAVQQPGWGASIPELVPRTQLRAASRLDLVQVNLSRVVGPALAGLVIAHLGGSRSSSP